MNDTDTKMMEHGYYEVYVPVWNPQTGDRPVNLTVDIYGDEETLREINPDLEQTIVDWMDDAMGNEGVIANYLHDLLHHDLVMDASCRQFDIDSADDLEARLGDPDFQIFPL